MHGFGFQWLGGNHSPLVIPVARRQPHPPRIAVTFINMSGMFTPMSARAPQLRACRYFPLSTSTSPLRIHDQYVAKARPV